MEWWAGATPLSAEFWFKFHKQNVDKFGVQELLHCTAYLYYIVLHIFITLYCISQDLTDHCSILFMYLISNKLCIQSTLDISDLPGCVAQSVGHLTRKSGVLGLIPGLATYFRFSFRFFKKGGCQLLAKVCAQGTG